jgi:hypothetical protein
VFYTEDIHGISIMEVPMTQQTLEALYLCLTDFLIKEQK